MVVTQEQVRDYVASFGSVSREMLDERMRALEVELAGQMQT